MFQTIKNAWHITDTRRKIIFTLFIVLLYRIGSSIPVPYVDSEVWANQFSSAAKNESLWGYLGVIGGSGFINGTLLALGISPYITSSIVMQLLTIAIPPLERMSKQPDGQKKITQITRYVTVLLAVITAFGYYLTMKNSNAITKTGFFAGLVIVTCYVAGASIIMWLGEKINDKGIGNGISIILFFNIISRFGTYISSAISIGSAYNWIWVLVAAVIVLALIVFIVWMTNSERRLPVQYAKRTVGRKMYGGMNTHLPIKLSMSGVMPIIFASSIISLPSTIGMIIGADQTKGVWKFLSMTGPVGIALNFILIISFSYFYLTISFNPVEVANNLKKNGGTILGYRPGQPTAAYIQKVLNRITLIGALFLAVIAVLPQLISLLFSDVQLGVLVFGGSSLIIIVGVILETIKELESEVTMRHYKGFLE